MQALIHPQRFKFLNLLGKLLCRIKMDSLTNTHSIERVLPCSTAQSIDSAPASDSVRVRDHCGPAAVRRMNRLDKVKLLFFFHFCLLVPSLLIFQILFNFHHVWLLSGTNPI